MTGKLARRNLEKSLGERGRVPKVKTNNLCLGSDMVWGGEVWNPYHWHQEKMERIDPKKNLVAGQKRKAVSINTEEEVEAALNLWKGMDLVGKMAERAVKQKKETPEASGSS